MKALNVIQSAYRGTLEEQDDTIVWITHAMRGAGADIDVLLCGNAVNYAVKGQDASGLSFGDRRQKHAPRIAEDIAALPAKGVAVHIVADDLVQRGLAAADLIDGPRTVARADIPALYERYDQVWHW